MSAEDRKAENAQAIEILSREIQSLDENTYPTAKTVCENELFRLRGGIADTVDVVDNRRVKIRTKVNIPSEQYPSINFVGKLLGPGGSTLRTIQEETRTKMAILGRGSLRDEAKEKELLSGGDPKYQHLKYPLHLQIDALAPPAEAYYNISHALAQVRRIMVPDANGQQPPQQQQQTTSWAAAPPVPPVPARGGGVMRGRGGRGRGGFANQAPFVPIPAGFTSPPPVPMRGRGGAARGRGGWGMNNGAPGNGSGAAPGNGDVYNNGMDQYGSYPDQMGYDQNQYGTSGFEDYSGVYGQSDGWGKMVTTDNRGRARAHPYVRQGVKEETP